MKSEPNARAPSRVTPSPVVPAKGVSLHRQLFCEPSPAPAKWALHRLGLCRPAVRLPILPLTAAGQNLVDAALRDAGLT